MTPATAPAPELFFEDFTPGRVFDLGRRTLTEDDIVAFAAAWDPQPFHLDRAVAAREAFGGLMASGWHTACVWMRLYVDAVLLRAAMLPAPGVEELRWLRPVRPGETLRGRATVVDAWPSDGAPGRGTMRLHGELLDLGDEPVMTLIGRGQARLRAAVAVS